MLPPRESRIDMGLMFERALVFVMFVIVVDRNGFSAFLLFFCASIEFVECIQCDEIGSSAMAMLMTIPTYFRGYLKFALFFVAYVGFAFLSLQSV